ncbi:uncharacterized protein PHACADRAFT_100538, partial [Phanerochaete carnosa HHB-10118-sp]
VIQQRQRGSYLLAELDGTSCKQAIAAFHIVPYISRSTVLLRPYQVKVPKMSFSGNSPKLP